jgi:hypothetical protein
MMVVAAKKMKLKFEDVYGQGADSPDGTWKGITRIHTYEFVFLCFMNAFAKKVRRVNYPAVFGMPIGFLLTRHPLPSSSKIVNPQFQSKIKSLFPGEGICHPGPVKTMQR